MKEVILIVLAAALGYVIGRVDSWWIRPSSPATEPLAVPPAEIESSPAAEFPVAGKQRHVPWAQRRRVLESRHRTKRAIQEQWD